MTTFSVHCFLLIMLVCLFCSNFQKSVTNLEERVVFVQKLYHSHCQENDFLSSVSFCCRWRRTSLNISELCTRFYALTPPCGVFLPGTTMVEMPWWIHLKRSCSTEQTSSLAWAGCCSRKCGRSWNTSGPPPSGTTGCANRSSARNARAFDRKFHGLSRLVEKESV